MIRITSRASHVVELPELDLTFPLVDVFPDGRVLVVAPRCAWRAADDFDLNGAIIEPQTGEVSKILLGDGISTIQIDGLGRIWAGYCDEGVFGNFGWGALDGPHPVGAAGLVVFRTLARSFGNSRKAAITQSMIATHSTCLAQRPSRSSLQSFLYAELAAALR